jgi:fructosamine-3-kinase
VDVQPYENISIVEQVVRAIFPTHHRLIVVRVTEGVSTIVYRVEMANNTYYLRIWPMPDESFVPEVTIHRHLRALGLHVPEVVYFEQHNTLVERSIMMTTTITGQALGDDYQPAHLPRILYEAGRELALINQVAVQGFGWMDRTTAELGLLRAEHLTFSEWLSQNFAAELHALGSSGHVTLQEVDILLSLLAQASAIFENEPAALAHGDFDGTHIFAHNAGYSGMIDFSEIRGTHRFYDLGHFGIAHGAWLPALLDGYSEIAPVSRDYLRLIQLTILLIAAQKIGYRVLHHREPQGSLVTFIKRMLPHFI